MGNAANEIKASELLESIRELEKRTQRLREKLISLQSKCVHEFVSSELMKTCPKCLHSESIYY